MLDKGELMNKEVFLTRPPAGHIGQLCSMQQEEQSRTQAGLADNAPRRC